jgi:hypothetical protein
MIVHLTLKSEVYFLTHEGGNKLGKGKASAVGNIIDRCHHI